MSAAGTLGRLGYALDRSRDPVAVRGLGDRVLLLGRQVGGLATLFAYAAAEAGLRLAIVDVDGSVSPKVRGYFRAADYRATLYEAFQLEGEDASHGQLVASAYAAALDLTPEEEAILSAALQELSIQGDLAAPSALYDVLGAIEGFRGYYVDKLKGRIGGLRHLDATRAQDFEALMRGGVMVNFESAPYPQAAELAAGLHLAKVLHLLGRSTTRPDAIMVTGAHRLFRDLTRFQHSGKLMAHLLEAPIALVLASPLPALLNSRLIESMPVRVYSSEAWNASRDSRWPAALACSYTVCDDRAGVSVGFVPRFVRPRPDAAAPPPLKVAKPTAELTRTVLQEISRFDTANRPSVVSYLSPQFLPGDVGAEIDRLHSEGYLVMEPKQSGSGPRTLAYTLTESGRRLLQELTG